MDWQATAARGSRNLAVATPQRSGSIDANLLLSNPRYMSCVLSYIASLSAPVIEELGWSYVEPYKDIKDIEYMKKSCDQDITLNQCIKGWFIPYQNQYILYVVYLFRYLATSSKCRIQILLQCNLSLETLLYNSLANTIHLATMNITRLGLCPAISNCQKMSSFLAR